MKKIIISIFVFLLLEGCSRVQRNESVTTDTIDSVWCTKPGTPYPFQTDVIYFGRTTKGFQISKRGTPIKVGDTVVYIRKI